jgi:hypothetical protein
MLGSSKAATSCFFGRHGAGKSHLAAALGHARRRDALAGCQQSSGEETELKTIVDLLEAYAAKRWPLGKEPGGQG